MWKKLAISIVILILLGIGIELIYLNRNSSQENNANNQTSSNEVTNITEISEETVEDDCISEWEDYQESSLEELENASNNYENESTHYLVKSVENYINVYYVDDAGNEILYRETKIDVSYLEEEDVKALEEGIDIYGTANLNKLLEDFE